MRDTKMDWKQSELTVGDPYEGKNTWGRVRHLSSGRWYYQAGNVSGVVTEGFSDTVSAALRICEAWIQGRPVSDRLQGHVLKCAVECECA